MHKQLVWLAIFLGGCATSPYPIEYKTLNGSWNSTEILTFNLEETALHSPHHLYFHLRNTDAYAYSNIFLIARLKDTTQTYFADTLEYAMATPQGNWLGKGFGEVKESVLWWKESIQIETKGPVTIELEHAMRTFGQTQGVPVLTGIVNVGLGLAPQNKENK
ncbi:MAG: gliding motility lipoprotein GldH [Flavobacteriaceae bacterium]